MNKKEIAKLNKKFAKTYKVDLTRERVDCKVSLIKVKNYLINTYNPYTDEYNDKFFIIHVFNHYKYKSEYDLIESIHKDLLQFIKINVKENEQNI